MENAKKHYWAIFQNKEVLFSGSHTECWNWLVEQYAVCTVASLSEAGIKLARFN